MSWSLFKMTAQHYCTCDHITTVKPYWYLYYRLRTDRTVGTGSGARLAALLRKSVSETLTSITLCPLYPLGFTSVKWWVCWDGSWACIQQCVSLAAAEEKKRAFFFRNLMFYLGDIRTPQEPWPFSSLGNQPGNGNALFRDRCVTSRNSKWCSCE